MNVDALLDEAAKSIETQFPAKEVGRYSIKNLTSSCHKLLDQADEQLESLRLSNNRASQVNTFKVLSRAVLFVSSLVFV